MRRKPNLASALIAGAVAAGSSYMMVFIWVIPVLDFILKRLAKGGKGNV